MIEVSAPGKLMLSGEWSVLETGIPCIVLSVNRRVSCSIKPSERIRFDAPDVGLNGLVGSFDGRNMVWNNKLTPEEREKLTLGEKAIEISLRYLKESEMELYNFHIITKSEIHLIESGGRKEKIGFGSSAAAVVAIVGAILRMHGQDIVSKKAKDIIYKLAACAHYIAQGKVGSAFDIAASVYGGAVIYRRFDPKWFAEQMGSGRGIKDMAESEWKDFHANTIDVPEDLNLCVGWTGKGASTKELVAKLNDFKVNRKERYDELIGNIRSVTERLVIALVGNDESRILSLIRENRDLLKQLSDESGNNLETEQLAMLADIADRIGGAGKFSGAGGGDCGLAICFDYETARKIMDEWEKSGLHPIDVGISCDGLRIERCN